MLVKADQYTTEQVVGHESVLRRGGQVVSVPTCPRYSTTDLIGRIQELPSGSRKLPRIARSDGTMVAVGFNPQLAIWSAVACRRFPIRRVLRLTNPLAFWKAVASHRTPKFETRGYPHSSRVGPLFNSLPSARWANCW